MNRPIRRRRRRASWAWHITWTPPDTAPTGQTAPDRDTAEQIAATVIRRGAADVTITHIDRAGWRTSYPLRPIAAATS